MICGACGQRLGSKTFVCCPWCGFRLAEVGVKRTIRWGRSPRLGLLTLAGALVALVLLAVWSMSRTRARQPIGLQFLDEGTLAFVATRNLSALFERLGSLVARLEAHVDLRLADQVFAPTRGRAHQVEAGLRYGLAAAQAVIGARNILASVVGLDLASGAMLAVLDGDEPSLLAVVVPEIGSDALVRFALKSLILGESTKAVAVYGRQPHGDHTIESFELVEGSGEVYFAFVDGYCVISPNRHAVVRALGAADSSRPTFWDSPPAGMIRHDGGELLFDKPYAVLAYCDLGSSEWGRNVPSGLSYSYASLVVNEHEVVLRGRCEVRQTQDRFWNRVILTEPVSFGGAGLVPEDALAFLSVRVSGVPGLWDAGREELASNEREAYDSFLRLLEDFDSAGEDWFSDDVVPNLGTSTCLVIRGLQHSTDGHSPPAPECVVVGEVHEAEAALAHLERMRQHYYVSAHLMADTDLLRDALLRFNFLSVQERDPGLLEQILSSSLWIGEQAPDLTVDFATFVRHGLLRQVPMRHWPSDRNLLLQLGLLPGPGVFTDPWQDEYLMRLEPTEEPLEERTDLLVLAERNRGRAVEYGPDDSFMIAAGKTSIEAMYLTPPAEDRRLRACYALLGNHVVVSGHRRWLEEVVDVWLGVVPSLEATTAAATRQELGRSGNIFGRIDVSRFLSALEGDTSLGDDGAAFIRAVAHVFSHATITGRMDDTGSAFTFRTTVSINEP